MRLRPLRRLILALFACTALWGKALQAEQIFIVSVFPQFSPATLHQDWTQLLSRVEQATGYRFQLRIYDQFQKFDTDMLAGIPDFAFLNAYQVITAKKAQGYIPLLRAQRGIMGILVVRADSPLRQLSDLNGQNVVFPGESAFAASVYMRSLLAEKEKISIRPSFAGSLENVYRQVLRGDAAAGGGGKASLNRQPPPVQAGLRILYTTPLTTPHAIAAHPRVSQTARARVVAALLDLNKDAKGQTSLGVVELSQPITADYQRDYAALEKLHLHRYITPASNTNAH